MAQPPTRNPDLRTGSFLPVILERRRRIDQAPYADAGVSKSEAFGTCAGVDEQVGAFRTRALDHTHPPTSTSTPPTAAHHFNGRQSHLDGGRGDNQMAAEG
ncbi:hypothetical protein JCM18899A_48420 [Nocardioides sp. AN3]